MLPTVTTLSLQVDRLEPFPSPWLPGAFYVEAHKLWLIV
jgi:hypothetical protein